MPPATGGVIVVVGLGPAGADLLLPAGRSALSAVPVERRFCRTSRHPAVDDLAAQGLVFGATFDEVYETAASSEELYPEIARRLLAAAEAGDVAFAVPGSPAVGERTVELLRATVPAGRLRVIPGLSFVDLAWARLGVDPTAGATATDGKALPAALPAGPLLVSHCHSRLVLSDVKLALLERLDGDAPVTVLQGLGLPGEVIRTLPLADLDRDVEPDHLTSVFAELPPGGPGAAWERLVALVERLRGPDGCPWDAEQTHHSLARYSIEEAYEVVEAIEALPADSPGGPTPVPDGAYEALCDELGDLTVQVLLHAALAREAGAFTITDVLDGLHDKLVRRHPHVFGDVAVAGADEVVANWEANKRAEQAGAGTGRGSAMDGVSAGLPALLYLHKLYRKADSAGLRWTAGEVTASARGHLDALAAGLVSDIDGGGPGEALEEHVAGLLADAVYLARLAGAEGESALRGWAARFRARFGELESEAEARGVPLATLWPEKS